MAFGKLFLTFDKVAFYLYSGANELGSKNKAGFVQMWESIKYFKSLGFEILDFDGVADDRFPGFSRRWKGFTSFKEKFGCKTLKYPNPYLKVFNPFLKFILNVTRVDL